MTDYRATPEHWATLEEESAPEYDSTILELRARVEQLEAATHKYIIETRANILALASRVEALEANRPEKPYSSDPAGSLVERLAKTIYGPSNIQEGWRSEARAAIREVAAWMRENECGYNAVRWLEQEAKQ